MVIFMQSGIWNDCLLCWISFETHRIFHFIPWSFAFAMCSGIDILWFLTLSTDIPKWTITVSHNAFDQCIFGSHLEHILPYQAKCSHGFLQQDDKIGVLEVGALGEMLTGSTHGSSVYSMTFIDIKALVEKIKILKRRYYKFRHLLKHSNSTMKAYRLPYPVPSNFYEMRPLW